MKILIVGSDHIWSIERFYKKHLEEQDVDVELFPAQNMFYQFYQKSLLNKIFFRLGLSNIFKRINGQLLIKAMAFKPDVIWVFKGMEVLPETLKKLKEKKFFLANFNGDSPFIFSGKGSGNKNVTNSIQLFDLHFTYDQSTKEAIKEKFHIDTAILPFGYEVSESVMEELKKEQEILKLCFLGNADAERIKFLKELSNAGIKTDVYGNGWETLQNEKNISAHGPVYGDGFWKTLFKYRVQLNLMRPHNPESHNMRTFEVPGIGGILLAPDTADHKTYFEPGKEIFIYKDLNSCIVSANYLLSISKEEADKIRFAARKRSIESNYSYKGRAIQALETLSTYKNEKN